MYQAGKKDTKSTSHTDTTLTNEPSPINESNDWGNSGPYADPELNIVHFGQIEESSLNEKDSDHAQQFYNPKQDSPMQEQRVYRKDETSERAKQKLWRKLLKTSRLFLYLVKNVNMPKFFFKCFSHYFKNWKAFYQGNPEVFEETSKRVIQLEKWTKSKNNSPTLQHLERLFVSDDVASHEKPRSQTDLHRINRRVMHQILRNTMKQEILRNAQVKQTMSYAIASKVFALRCFNQLLSTRIQSK